MERTPIRTDYGSSTVSNGVRKQDVNYSDILTKLIQDAGRICDSYASDLFIHWRYNIVDKMNNNELTTSTYEIGFRQSGVEMGEKGSECWNTRLETFGGEIVKMMELEIICGKPDMFGDYTITMNLYGRER